MTIENPLQARRKAVTNIVDAASRPVIRQHGKSYAQCLAETYNNAMDAATKRSGRLWVAVGDAIKLEFPEAFSVAHTKELAAQRERDRADWKWRQEHPISAMGGD